MTNFSPSPMQVLILWKMIFLNETPPFSKVSKPIRQPLMDAGLVSAYKKGRTSFLRLEDQAWDWAVQNLDAKVTDRSPQSGTVLQQVLTILKKYLQQNNLSLHEFMKTEKTREIDITTPVFKPTSIDHGNIASLVRDAYFKYTNGRAHIRMRLAILRECLSGITRTELDDTLIHMKRENQIHLFPFEDPQEKNESDDEAALYEASRLNHVIVLED